MAEIPLRAIDPTDPTRPADARLKLRLLEALREIANDAEVSEEGEGFAVLRFYEAGDEIRRAVRICLAVCEREQVAPVCLGPTYGSWHLAAADETSRFLMYFTDDQLDRLIWRAEGELAERACYARGWAIGARGEDAMGGAYLHLAMLGSEGNEVLAETSVSTEDMTRKWGFDWDVLGGGFDIATFENTGLSGALARGALRREERRKSRRLGTRLRRAWAALRAE